MSASVKRRLEVDAANGRVRNGEVHDAPDLVLVHATLDGRDDRGVQSGSREPIERANLLVDDVCFAAERERRRTLEPVELKVERRLDVRQLRHEVIVARDAPAVGVDHDEPDASRLGRLHEVDDLRMDRRLAA